MCHTYILIFLSIPWCSRSKILRKAGSVCVCLFSHDILPHLYFRCQWTPHAPMTLKSQELCEHPRFWSLTWKRWLKIGLKHEFSKNFVTFIFASHEVAVCLLLKTIFGSNCLNSQLLTLAQIKFDWKPDKTSNGLPTHCLLKCAAFSYYRKFSVSREYQIVTASMLGIQDAGCLNKTCRTWHSFKGWQALFYPNVGRLCGSFISSQLDIYLTWQLTY